MRRSLVCMTLFILVGGSVLAQQPQPPDPPAMTRDDLVNVLRLLQIDPNSPDATKDVLNTVKGMSPEEQQRLLGMLKDKYGDEFIQNAIKDVATSKGQFDPLKKAEEQYKGRPDPSPLPTPESMKPGGPSPAPEVPGGPINPPGRPGSMPPPGGESLTPQGSPAELASVLKGRPDARRFVQFWEKNFGPLDKTPSLKSAMLDILRNAGEGGPRDGGSLFSALRGDGPGGLDFGKLDVGKLDWLGRAAENGPGKLPDMGLGGALGKFAPDTGGWGTPSAPSGGMSFDPSFAAGVSATTIVLLLAAAFVGYLLWRFWPQVRAAVGMQPQNLAARPWPFDPLAVADRAALVRAFEFLSLRLCGDAARVWNHRTIAAAIRARAAGAAAVADDLARLYELARYSPPDAPLPAESLADARRCLAHLAGVTPP